MAELMGPETGEVGASGEGARGGYSPRLSRAEWILLLVLGAAQFTNIMDFMIVLPLGPQYQRELEISARQFGFMVFVYGFSASITGFLAACYIDRFDRKTALLYLYGGFTIGTFFCAIAPDYYTLTLARTVTGGFGGVVGALVLAIVGDVFSYARRGTATGVIMSAFSLASIAGVPAGLFLANSIGWRAPFFILAALSAMALVLAIRVLPSLAGHMKRDASQGLANAWAVLVHPPHFRAYLFMASLVLSTFIVIPYMAPYLVHNVGLDETDLPYVYLLGGIVTLATMNIVGRLSDRFGKLLLFRIMALATVVPVLAITNLPPCSVALVLIVTTLYMVCSSGRMVPATAMITGCATAASRGSFMSINASVQHMAAGLASLLGGLLIDELPNKVIVGYPITGYLSLGAIGVSLYLAGRLRLADDGKAVDSVAIAPDSETELVPVGSAERDPAVLG